jgi:hypothetical protein
MLCILALFNGMFPILGGYGAQLEAIFWEEVGM